MKLINVTLLIVCMGCIKSLSFHVSANSEHNPRDVSSELSKASVWDRFRATLQDNYSKFEGELTKKKAMIGEVLSKLDIPKMFDWNRYKAAYLKVYTNAREDLARQKIFFANVLKIVAHNLRFGIGEFTYFLSVNQFADYTPEESTRVYMREDELKSENLYNSDDNCLKHNTKNGGATGSRLEDSRDERKQSDIHEQNEGENELTANEITMKKNDNQGLDGRSRKMKKSCKVDYRAEKRDLIRETSRDVELEPGGFKAGELNESGSRESVVTDNRESQSPEEPTIADHVDLEDGSLIKSNTEIDDEAIFAEYQVDSTPMHVEDENNRVYLDLRDSGCFFMPRNQGKCASCYAFAGVALMEWWHCKQTGRLVPFSEQYMVDCGKHEGLAGCRGGNSPRSGRFFMNWGVELREKYPYIANESICPYEQEDWERASYKRPTLNKYSAADDLMKWPRMLVQSGPIMVLVRIPIPRDFLFYGGKVHKFVNCESTDRFIHMMLIVGYGKEDGQDYWLLRNSYGPQWGERGYFKLSTNFDRNCFYWANEIQVDFVNGSSHHSESLDGISLKKLKPFEAFSQGLITDKDLSELVENQ